MKKIVKKVLKKYKKMRKIGDFILTFFEILL